VALVRNQSHVRRRPSRSPTSTSYPSSRFVRSNPAEGHKFPEVFIPQGDTLDAASGDTVLVRIRRKPRPGAASPTGEIVQVLERATRQFVGTYFERDGEGLVRIDGTVVSDRALKVPAGTFVVQVGKRKFARVTLR